MNETTRAFNVIRSDVLLWQQLCTEIEKRIVASTLAPPGASIVIRFERSDDPLQNL